MTTKSDYVRRFVRDNPDIPNHELPRKIYQSNPAWFGTLRRAKSVVQNVRKHPRDDFDVIPPSSNGAISEEQLKKMFDIRSIVFEELRRLEQGRYWKDADFARRFQGKPGFRSVLESPEAQHFRGKASGQIFWSHPDSISRMKLEGVLI